jgi:hypothetical protein
MTPETPGGSQADLRILDPGAHSRGSLRRLKRWPLGMSRLRRGRDNLGMEGEDLAWPFVGCSGFRKTSRGYDILAFVALELGL